MANSLTKDKATVVTQPPSEVVFVPEQVIVSMVTAIGDLSGSALRQVAAHLGISSGAPDWVLRNDLIDYLMSNPTTAGGSKIAGVLTKLGGSLTGASSGGSAQIAVFDGSFGDTLESYNTVIPAHYVTVYPEPITTYEPIIGWNGSAVSNAYFINDGSVSFSIDENTAGIVIGLAAVGAEDNSFYNDIKFGILATNQQFRVIESSVLKTVFDGFVGTDVFKIEKISGVVTYYLNGVSIYESLTESTDTAIMLKSSLFLSGDTALNSRVIDIADLISIPANSANGDCVLGGLDANGAQTYGANGFCDLGGLNAVGIANSIRIQAGFGSCGIGGLDCDGDNIQRYGSCFIGGLDANGAQSYGANGFCDIGGLDCLGLNPKFGTQTTNTSTNEILSAHSWTRETTMYTRSEMQIVSSTQRRSPNFLALTFSPETEATSTYSNMPFIAAFNFQGVTLFANDDGLFEYGGTTDNGTEIVASIKTGKSNKVMGQGGEYSSRHRKRIPTPSFYIAMDKTAETVDLNLTLNDDAPLNYPITTIKTGLQPFRCKVGRGIKYNWIQVELLGFDVLESIEYEPQEIRRTVE